MIDHRNYDREVQKTAMAWWRTLSTNEQKAFEKKHTTIYGTAMRSEVAAIHRVEVIETQTKN